MNKYTRRNIYMTLIRPVVTYTCRTRTLSVWDINNLLVFERQILRKICGSIQCKEVWRIRSNKELQKLIKGADNVQYTKAQRIKWWGHLNRKEEIKLVKKIAEWNPIRVRTKGWPKNRWRDGVIYDLKKLKLWNWNQLIKDTNAWNNLVQKTKPK